jgi:AcrR family transcriptional regulator
VAPEPAEDRELSRGGRKHEVILAAARDLFLQNGYLGVSMDEVVAKARVSKQTLYKHFGDKSSLFLEVLLGDMAAADAQVAALAEVVPDSDNLQEDLTAFARAYIVSVMRPHLMRIRRVVIAEAERFPDLAEAWYRNGPERAYATFTQWFTRLHERGLLRTPDPGLAAQHFNWLVLSIPLNEAMSRPIADSPADPRDLHRYADEGVRVFLAAYRTSAPGHLPREGETA